MTDTTVPLRMSNPWVVLVMLQLIYVFNFTDRYLITGLVGPIKADFGLGDGFMGLLMGPAFVILYVVSGVPLARLADRSSRIVIIVVGCALWSLATISTGFATGPWSLALARVAVGIGEAAFAAPAYSLLTDYFRPERRGLAFAILGLANYIGQIVGQTAGPAIGAAASWRMAFWTLGAPGLLLCVLALLLVREPVRTVTVTATSQIPLFTMFSRLLATPSYMLMMVGFGFGSLSGLSFGLWATELVARSYGLDPVVAKSAFAVNLGLAGIVGIVSFGAISDWFAKRRHDGPLFLSAFGMAAATLFILLVSWAPSFAAARWLAIPAGLLGGGWSIGLLALLQDMLPPRYRATATAAFLAFTTLVGFLVGPPLVGAISEAFGDNAQSLRLGLTAVIPTGFIGAVLVWMAAKRIAADKARLAALE